MSTAPPERAGAAAGISEMSAELGGALGIALLGSVVTPVYRATVAGALAGDLLPDVLEAARGTLGGALSAARALPNELAAGVVSAHAAPSLRPFGRPPWLRPGWPVSQRLGLFGSWDEPRKKNK